MPNALPACFYFCMRAGQRWRSMAEPTMASECLANDHWCEFASPCGCQDTGMAHS
jgi:hypothetical protein